MEIHFTLSFHFVFEESSSEFTTEATVATLADFEAVLASANAEVDIITQKLQAGGSMSAADENKALADTTALKDRLVALGSGAPPTP